MHFWIQNKGSCWICNFNLTLIGSFIVTGVVDTCNARSALWINPSLCTVSPLHIKMHQYMHLLIWWYLFLLQHITTSEGNNHDSIQMQRDIRDTSSFGSILWAVRSIAGRESNERGRQVRDAWFQFAVGDDRWQTSIGVDAIHDLGLFDSWYGDAKRWMIVYCIMPLFLCFLRIHSTWPSLLVPARVDRELCDRESDMPWGIQMCMVSLTIMSSYRRLLIGCIC